MRQFLQKNISSVMVRKLSSFTYLNATQFLGALNDNLYKLLIVFFFIKLDGIDKSPRILATTGAVFVVPFLLFSAYSGTIADRFSKRNIIVFTKIFELVIMLGAIFAFGMHYKWISLIILFLLATQSAIFSPSKYGIIPELVETEKISAANGLLTSFTFLAVIFGTFLASFLLDITERNFVIAASFCTLVSILGIVASFCIEYTPPSGSKKKFTPFFLMDIFKTLKSTRSDPVLFTAILSSAFFFFIASFTQLNMIPFAVQSLHLADTQGGYIFLLMSLGIGAGSLIAGKISGKTIELALVPLACLGMTVCFYLLDFMSGHIWVIIPVVIISGIFGGIFQIPIDSYVQVASPNNKRGQIVATGTFLSFIGVLMSSCFLFLMTDFFGFEADKGFTVMGGITLFVSIALCFVYFDYVARFFGMILSRLHFKIEFEGQEHIPITPAIFVCQHTDWNDTLLMLGSQRRRLRFFIEQEHDHYKWLKKLYYLLRIVQVPSPEPLVNNQYCLNEIKDSLKKGVSVCIFVENQDIEHEIQKLLKSFPFQEILREMNSIMIPVEISKGIKAKTPRIFKRLMERFRVPASVSFKKITI